eukprot:TRINITY_DN15575_c0_g1_i1.p2 TRINITY_DN15575_c0_g1~~TRINITY_DN15575_c0_g1_i1.p2  ORF type:complete len:126 (+),score=31.82 TRINITY_DN15575_c0_g1_i1:283-660(+)
MRRQGPHPPEYVGSVRNDCPSVVVKVPVSLVDVARETPLDLVLSLEPLEQISQLEMGGVRRIQDEARGVTWAELAKRLAADLAEFIGGLGAPQPQPGVLVVPARHVQRWLSRVTTKFQRDSSWWS